MVRKIKKQKPIIYIFCEWKTEKKYFTQLSRILNNNFKVISVDLEWWTKIMDHPEQIKRKIEWKLEHDKTEWLIQKVFIVFDLDIFIDRIKLQNAQNILKDYELIYNNECFEYWILSHFKKYDLWKWKKKYLDEIRKFLPKLPLWKDYKMVWDEDFGWLENIEKVNIAIKNVKEVNKSYWNLKDIDPYSNVYEIIEFLER
jgi:hypothetical protein